MSSPINIKWLRSAIKSNLTTRLSTTQIDSLQQIPEKVIIQLVNEIEQSILIYNNLTNTSLYVNCQHLKNLTSKLPPYAVVLHTLTSDKKLFELVFNELSNSTYFHDVYKISDPNHLLSNIMTLIYRGYMLHTYPELRVKGAQISSVLEEMSALRYLSGNDSLHFQATRHWILDWENEGFSEHLAMAITTYHA